MIRGRAGGWGCVGKGGDGVRWRTKRFEHCRKILCIFLVRPAIADETRKIIARCGRPSRRFSRIRTRTAATATRTAATGTRTAATATRTVATRTVATATRTVLATTTTTATRTVPATTTTTATRTVPATATRTVPATGTRTAPYGSRMPLRGLRRWRSPSGTRGSAQLRSLIR
jgi:hypothetical protein